MDGLHCRCNHIKCVLRLLQYNRIDIILKNTAGSTALDITCNKNYREIIELLEMRFCRRGVEEDIRQSE